MTDRELMQMALDALKKVNDTGFDTCRYKQFDKEVKALRDRLKQLDALDKMGAENERLGLYKEKIK